MSLVAVSVVGIGIGIGICYCCYRRCGPKNEGDETNPLQGRGADKVQDNTEKVAQVNYMWERVG